MQEIRNYLEKIAPLSDDDWAFFSQYLEIKKLPKNALLLKAGQIEKHISFIEKGMARLCFPKEEQDLTFAFAFEGEFVSGYDSFILQKPSCYFIETLTQTELWQISYESLQEVYRNTGIGEHIGRIISERLFLKKSEREISFLNQTAEERYIRLFEENPKLLQSIPLKYIASYIGITPQALSRIRKRIS